MKSTVSLLTTTLADSEYDVIVSLNELAEGMSDNVLVNVTVDTPEFRDAVLAGLTDQAREVVVIQVKDENN